MSTLGAKGRDFQYVVNCGSNYNCLRCGVADAKMARAGIVCFCMKCVEDLFPKIGNHGRRISDKQYMSWVDAIKRNR